MRIPAALSKVVFAFHAVLDSRGRNFRDTPVRIIGVENRNQINLPYCEGTNFGHSKRIGIGLVVADCHARTGLWRKGSKEDTCCSV